ncbi:hypothetical protein BGX23_009766 [Mortierella sp. AD031]|nr:hypothetical protein BGX23_009766 [Mortierella sp. AD031]
MKISTLCIISLGLSLAVFGDAARAKQQQHKHHDNKHVDHHHHHTPKEHNHHRHVDNHHHHHKADHSHHKKQADYHHHLKANAIPSKPYKEDHHDHKDHTKKKDHHHHHHHKEEPAHEVSHHDNDADLEEHKKPSDAATAPPLRQDPVMVPVMAKKEKMVVAYWTDWTSATMPPEAIPFDKVTRVNYAFSIVSPDFRPVFQTDYLLNRVVRAAHAKGVKVLMSIGGWTGSQYFSPLAASPQGRKTLSMALLPWEYPGRMGSAGNIYDEKNDAKNFLQLLKELRMAMNQLPKGEALEISLATRLLPFDGPDGKMKDVSEFSKVVNHINVMAYDINGSWGTLTGVNSPLGGAGDLTYANGAQVWISAGFPAGQINMGVPFYGRSLTTQSDMTTTQSMQAPFVKPVPLGDKNDALWTDPCEKEAAYSGVWKFKNLREEGLIDFQGNAHAPWICKFDEESKTPWLFNPKTRQFISYDDRESLRLKVEYAKERQLGGVMLWAINQDTTDFELLDVLQDIRR